MHDCQKLRERVIDEFVGAPPEHRKLERVDVEGCAACGRFLAESLDVCRAVDAFGAAGASAPFIAEGAEPAETADANFAWRRFETSFRRRLAAEPPPRFRPLAGWIDIGPRWLRFEWPVFGFGVAAAVLGLIVVVGLYRGGNTNPAGSAENNGVREAALGETPLPLTAETVKFLGRSEMFLRTFTKIDPSDVADIRDARDRARSQLTVIEQRKTEAVSVPPVWAALKEYETVLREIKNLDDASAIDEVRDIQDRVSRRGLIATMKGYQPHVLQIAYQGR